MFDFYYNCLTKRYPSDKELSPIYSDHGQYVISGLLFLIELIILQPHPETSSRRLILRLGRGILQAINMTSDLVSWNSKHLEGIVCFAPRVRSMLETNGAESNKAKGLQQGELRHRDFIKAWLKIKTISGTNRVLRRMNTEHGFHNHNDCLRE